MTLADLAPLDQGSAITTPDGRIEYTAPGTGDGGVVTVGYSASDGRADPVQDSFDVQVLPSDATTATAAVTQPDVVRGEAGKPVAITPLMNDIQGSDPVSYTHLDVYKRQPQSRDDRPDPDPASGQPGHHRPRRRGQ